MWREDPACANQDRRSKAPLPREALHERLLQAVPPDMHATLVDLAAERRVTFYALLRNINHTGSKAKFATYWTIPSS